MSSFYVAKHNDIVTLKAQHDPRGRYAGVVFLVEAITSGKMPLIIVAADGSVLKVNDDMIELYTGADRDQVAATLPDNNLLERGTIIQFPTGTGGHPADKLWVITDMASSGMYTIALLGGGDARRGYLRHLLHPISLASAAAHLAAN